MRPADELMRLERLGALQPTQLSFAQSFVRLADGQRWRVERTRFDLDADGHGVASYRVTAPGDWLFTVVLYGYAPNHSERTDRIIGSAWDVTATLVEGEPSEEQIASQEQELLRLYEGRATPNTLIWARAQRSMRAFELTVDALARGEQPPGEVLATTGYLMRNTGMDGNGTFGTKTFAAYEHDHPLRQPYHAQMLTAYVVREFSLDLADHLAACRGGAQATRLSPELRRYLGIGNSSGLGLMLYVNNHADFLDRWLVERESRLAAGLELSLDATVRDFLVQRLHSLADDRAADRTRDPGMSVPFGQQVAQELGVVVELIHELATQAGSTIGDVVTQASSGAALSLESEELLNAAVIDFVLDHGLPSEDVLLGSPAEPWNPTLALDEVRALVETRYAWALRAEREGLDSYYAWYQSQTAEEPRRGPATSLPSPRYDLTLDLPADLSTFIRESSGQDPATPIGLFLLDHPHLRAIVERVVVDRRRRYHTVVADQRSRKTHAPHVIRLVNSAFFGISKTRGQGPLGTVGVLLLGAPSPGDLGTPQGTWAPPVELAGKNA